MASSYTANHGLCQWEPGDAFVRTEFNEDNRRIDAALKAAEEETARVERAASGAAAGAQAAAQRALDGVENVSYNLSNLLLQRYYEDKYTGFKRALLFDGFRDQSMVASKSPHLLSGAGGMSFSGANMEGTLQNASSWRFETSAPAESGAVTATGSGRLYQLEIMVIASTSTYVGTQELTFTVLRNGSAMGTKTQSVAFGLEEKAVTVPLSTPVAVSAGDRISFRCSGHSTNRRVACTSGGGGALYGVFAFRGAAATSAALTSRAAELPAAERLLAWARHTGGAVALSVRDGAGVSRALSLSGTRPGQNAQGGVCVESAFRLDERCAAGDCSVTLDLDLGDSSSMTLHDYGVVWL